jgi:hypothetical protein
MSGPVTRSMGQLPYFAAGSQPEQRVRLDAHASDAHH